MLTVVEAEELNKTLQERLLPPGQARALTNRFILEHLRDGFAAGQPTYALVHAEPVWIVPIMFARQGTPPAAVGEVLVQAIGGDVIGFTPPGEVLKNARAALAG